jgi:hypothetical protein
MQGILIDFSKVIVARIFFLLCLRHRILTDGAALKLFYQAVKKFLWSMFGVAIGISVDMSGRSFAIPLLGLIPFMVNPRICCYRG